jgi:hypothetical protein
VRRLVWPGPLLSRVVAALIAGVVLGAEAGYVRSIPLAC